MTRRGNGTCESSGVRALGMFEDQQGAHEFGVDSACVPTLITMRQLILLFTFLYFFLTEIHEEGAISVLISNVSSIQITQHGAQHMVDSQ